MITNPRIISFTCGCGYVQNIEHVQFFGHKSIKEIDPILANMCSVGPEPELGRKCVVCV